MKTCNDEPGYYAVNSRTCDKCLEPCHNCRGDRYNCTQCESAGKTPALFTNKIVLPAVKGIQKTVYRGTCYRQCPNGYYVDKTIPDDVRCSKCESPCGTCINRADYCLSCNGVWFDPKTSQTWQNMTYVFEGNCYDECPQTTAPDMSTLRCLGCGARCNQCGTAKDTCFECVTPDYVVSSKKRDYNDIVLSLSQQELAVAEAAWREERKYIPKLDILHHTTKQVLVKKGEGIRANIVEPLEVTERFEYEGMNLLENGKCVAKCDKTVGNRPNKAQT